MFNRPINILCRVSLFLSMALCLLLRLFVFRLLRLKRFSTLTNQAVATSQEAVQNQNEPQLRDENAHNDKSVHGVLNPTYQAGLRRDAVQPDIEAERKKRDEIEAGKSYCSRRFGGATC